MREEFENLPEIVKIIKSGDIFFNDVLGVYGSKSGDDLAAGFVSGSWYAYQEQQKKIDVVKELQIFYKKDLDSTRDGVGKAIIALYDGNDDLALSILKDILK